MSLPELQRREFVNSILNDLDDTVANTVEELRSILVGSIPGSITTVPQDSWNAERFQAFAGDATHAAGELWEECLHGLPEGLYARLPCRACA